MKPKTKKILLLGIGLIFIFAIVAVPLGVAIAVRPSLLPALGPGVPEITSDSPYAEFDYGFLGWDGTISGGADYSIEPK